MRIKKESSLLQNAAVAFSVSLLLPAVAAIARSTEESCSKREQQSASRTAAMERRRERRRTPSLFFVGVVSSLERGASRALPRRGASELSELERTLQSVHREQQRNSPERSRPSSDEREGRRRRQSPSPLPLPDLSFPALLPVAPLFFFHLSLFFPFELRIVARDRDRSSDQEEEEQGGREEEEEEEARGRDLAVFAIAGCSFPIRERAPPAPSFCFIAVPSASLAALGPVDRVPGVLHHGERTNEKGKGKCFEKEREL